MSDEKQTGPVSEKDIPPWLQPVPEDDEGEARGTVGSRTMMIMAGIAVTVVALFVLVLFYLYDGTSDGQPRHIVAETTPAKERPADPGGMDIPHRDKAVFEQDTASPSNVTLAPQPEEPLAELPEDQAEPEGADSEMDALVERVTQQMNGEQPVPDEPMAEKTASAPEPMAQEAAAAEETVASGATRPAEAEQETQASADQAAAEAPVADEKAYRVQLGAYGSEESAAGAWRTIRGKYQSIVGTLSPSYETVQSGGRTLYRLRVGPIETRAAADEVCLGLRAQQQACMVVNP